MIYPIKLIAVIILLCAIVFELCSCSKIDVDNGHKCRWEYCPYKNVTPDNYGRSVTAYVGNDESEAYSIDVLHLLAPNADYDELETMLNED